jgi:hypothetical protein
MRVRSPGPIKPGREKEDKQTLEGCQELKSSRYALIFPQISGHLEKSGIHCPGFSHHGFSQSKLPIIF